MTDLELHIALYHYNRGIERARADYYAHPTEFADRKYCRTCSFPVASNRTCRTCKRTKLSRRAAKRAAS